MPHPLAGKPVPPELLIDITVLTDSYGSVKPDPEDPSQRVQFGTSGHRGTSSNGSFNEAHVLAITQAVCEYRSSEGITGPLWIGFDTHALSEPAFRTVVEVAAANDVQVRYQEGFAPTPTPVISNRILRHNGQSGASLSDGIIITPSHNPPSDGGIKYNPPSGGPAEAGITAWIESKANHYLGDVSRMVQRMPFEQALRADGVRAVDFVMPYVDALGDVLDMEMIAGAGLKLGADPLGGSGAGYWDVIAERFGVDIEVVNPVVDPTFSFMRVDSDGKIRMDCSSAHAMAGLIEMKDRFDIAFGNDPDFDRHGIVTRTSGLMNPNHYLAVAVDYLFRSRSGWPAGAAVGKTLVSSSMIDRVAGALGRRVVEVPVGFKWFVDGLASGELGFGGEESAGASFLARDGSAWSTDKDGFILALLAAEIMTATSRDPSEHYADLTRRHGSPAYSRIDAPASRAQKQILKAMNREDVTARELAGDPITRILTHAPGNDEPIGGLKVETAQGWFAARPSGTEDIYKVYAESFSGEDHLARIQQEAQDLVSSVFKGAAG